MATLLLLGLAVYMLQKAARHLYKVSHPESIIRIRMLGG